MQRLLTKSLFFSLLIMFINYASKPVSENNIEQATENCENIFRESLAFVTKGKLDQTHIKENLFDNKVLNRYVIRDREKYFDAPVEHFTRLVRITKDFNELDIEYLNYNNERDISEAAIIKDMVNLFPFLSHLEQEMLTWTKKDLKLCKLNVQYEKIGRNSFNLRIKNLNTLK